MKFYIADAFSSVEFGGQATAVILPQRKTFIDQDVMLKTAAELRYSEIVFAIPSDDKPDKGFEEVWEARFFTAKEERDSCTHAIVALMQSLMDASMIKPGKWYQIKTKDKIFPVSVEAGIIMMDFEEPEIVDSITSDEEIKEIYQALGLESRIVKEGLDVTGYGELPLAILKANVANLIVPVSSLDELNSIEPDFDKISELSAKYGVYGFHVFTMETIEKNDEVMYIHCRNFSPLIGDSEEAATGSANATLSYYLVKNNVIKNVDSYKTGDIVKCTFVQGEKLGRSSKTYCHLKFIEDTNGDGCPDVKIRIGGRGVVLVDGHIDLSNYM